jgi:NAD-reducing hydrogenase small subunit
MKKKKLNIGWFSFSCCEDSTIMFTELLNEHYEKWFKILNFKNAKILQTKNTLKDIDVAFVEGAITSDEMIKELKDIRKNSKRVVAIGNCAVMGMPSAQRNTFDERSDIKKFVFQVFVSTSENVRIEKELEI